MNWGKKTREQIKRLNFHQNGQFDVWTFKSDQCLINCNPLPSM